MFAGNGPAMADEWLKSDDHSKGYALLPNEDKKISRLARPLVSVGTFESQKWHHAHDNRADSSGRRNDL